MDDASVDSTPEILNTYNDNRIQIIRNEKNMGLSYSRNLAIENARGEYIAIIDTDDICLPARLEKQKKICWESKDGCPWWKMYSYW